MKGQKPERGTSGAPRSGLRSLTAVRAEATSVNTDSKGAPLYIASKIQTDLSVVGRSRSCRPAPKLVAVAVRLREGLNLFRKMHHHGIRSTVIDRPFRQARPVRVSRLCKIRPIRSHGIGNLEVRTLPGVRL